MGQSSKLPLNGIRVIEIASVVLGPYAAQLLGDLGADVIKIEPPYGDSNRHVGPFRRNADMAAFFLACNRNKRSIVLDLKSENGLEAARALIAGADVLLHNHKPATIRRLGLDYDSVSRISPALVYCATYGYGERGCYAGKGAFDDSVQAAAGIAALLETVSGTPGYVPTLVADKTTALFVVQAVLAALFHRERTGEGQAIEVPMFESTVAWLMVEHLWGQSFDPALGQMAYPRLLAEFRRPYRCRDGRFLAVLPYRDPHWRAFCEIADRSELINDERFSTLAARTENIEGTYRITSEIVALKSREEWLDLLGPTSIPATPVNTLEELVDDPHLDAAGFWRFVDHPEEGRLRMPAYPVNFGATPATIRRPPPRLGEHSVEILREAGFDEVRIRQMLEAGETGGNGG